MVLIALLIGSIIIVAALRNSQGALFSALATDVPQFVVWGAAIFALGAIGWVPDLKPISRGLLALIIIVIMLRNYKGILGGFQAVATGAGAGSGAATGAGAGAATGASSGAATGAGSSSPTLSATAAPLALPIASAGGSSGGTTPAQAISPYGAIGGVGAGLPSFGVPSWSYSGLEDMLNPTSVIEGTNGSN